ncbi:MAG: hypothetical protein RIK87_19200 [Fuerstiella sp.]
MTNLKFLVLLLYFAANASAQNFRPNLGPDLPTITVSCGDITVLLRRETQWTPGRFDFRGTPMTTEHSAYGTVFRFPEVGFIGTGHLENEPEDLQSLSFFLDGKPLPEPQATLTGQSFRFFRESRVRGFRLTNVIEIKANRLYETATITADADTPLDLVYHFMHAWTPTMSELLAGNDGHADDDILQPLLDDQNADRSFYINRAVDWVAVYEPDSQQFAVSRLLEAPEATENSSKVWNCVGTYRKYYLTAFHHQSVPKGFSGTWKMVTAFGRANRDDWQSAARDLAKRTTM